MHIQLCSCWQTLQVQEHSQVLTRQQMAYAHFLWRMQAQQQDMRNQVACLQDRTVHMQSCNSKLQAQLSMLQKKWREELGQVQVLLLMCKLQMQQRCQSYEIRYRKLSLTNLVMVLNRSITLSSCSMLSSSCDHWHVTCNMALASNNTAVQYCCLTDHTVLYRNKWQARRGVSMQLWHRKNRSKTGKDIAPLEEFVRLQLLVDVGNRGSVAHMC